MEPAPNGGGEVPSEYLSHVTNPLYKVGIFVQICWTHCNKTNKFQCCQYYALIRILPEEPKHLLYFQRIPCKTRQLPRRIQVRAVLKVYPSLPEFPHPCPSGYPQFPPSASQTLRTRTGAPVALAPRPGRTSRLAAPRRNVGQACANGGATNANATGADLPGRCVIGMHRIRAVGPEKSPTARFLA